MFCSFGLKAPPHKGLRILKNICGSEKRIDSKQKGKNDPRHKFTKF